MDTERDTRDLAAPDQHTVRAMIEDLLTAQPNSDLLWDLLMEHSQKAA